MCLLSLLEMLAKLSYFGAIFILLVSLSSCLKVESFPDEPVVVFDTLIVQGDSAIVKFSFTDGDGNFGLTQDDSNTPPFDEGIYQNNLIMDYYELIDGNWQRFGNDFPSTSPFFMLQNYNARVEWIEPEGTNKTQQGEISYTLLAPYFQPTSPYETFRFSFFIVDRDLNHSNTAVTSPLTKP